MMFEMKGYFLQNGGEGVKILKSVSPRTGQACRHAEPQFKIKKKKNFSFLL